MTQTQPFQVGYIDVDSSKTMHACFPNWKEADEFVKLYQRNAIPVWHVEYICPHCHDTFMLFEQLTQHLMSECTQNRSGASGFDRPKTDHS